ncbi:DNA ligase [Paenibacillus sp. 19GGS1-52]|uniref:DNA ligase n=1 Tax=Paenibacillus sp. 19GGS1-52 TaxID=2758563 RepID=UPI001EFA4B44|nr:DNA ligase [Paenibacillus sp. 19GGS1-52]ULO09636.1 DNA ligase [Paenibacillus sp. 19GGS1-52]
MNIGSLIRGLLGDNKLGEPKSLELKEGQIVRGVVLSVSDSGKEALVQIQGTPVRAELETPLQPGQTLNLQVGLPGEGGLPVLKPVSLGEAALVSPQSMGEALESLGLSDSKAGREIIQAMQSGGLVLTKETAAKLDAVMNAKPAGVSATEWLEAAVISVKRGLPVTVESVKGLQQAVFGPQLHQLLATLEESLSLWASQEAGKSELPAGTGEQKLTAPQASGTASAVIVGAADTGNEQAVNSQTGKAGVQTTGAVSEEQPVPAGAIQTTESRNKTNPAGNVAAPSLAKSETSGSGAIALVNVPEASEDSSGTAASRAAVDTGKTEVGASAKGNTAAEPAKGSTLASGNSAPSGVVANEVGAETEQSSVSVRSGAAPERTETARAAATGAALAGDAAGKTTAAPSGTALLAKLQGVLTELRVTVPQLAVALAPPASPAEPEQAPAATVPPQVAATAPPTSVAEPKQAPAATVPPQGAVTAPPASAAEPRQAPAASVPPQVAATAPPATAAGQPATPDIESWVGRVLKLLGAEHEQQAVRGGAAGVAAEARPAAAVLAAAGREAQLVPAALGQTISGGDHTADTLKGLLLQVLGSSDVPPAVKEAAGQLVQQLTGQQLLLNTDRTAPFAQVTLFLPLQGSDGEETASVHIQSRRGRKGELDAANCRLWFDLNMKQLGQTLVDVQVVDRMVSLKLHNNDPWVLELLEQSRDDIKTSVESIGYQLSGLRTEPLPEKNVMNDLAGNNAGKLADYVPDSYKGVDFRI